MNKWILWMLMLAGAALLAACSGGWNEVPSASQPSKPNQPAAANASPVASAEPGRSSQSAYRAAWASLEIPQEMTRGAEDQISVSVTNTSNQLWDAHDVAVSYHWYSDGGSNTMVDRYDGIRSALPSNVRPGEELAVDDVRVVAPSSPGSYLLQVTLVQEGVTWFETQGADTLTVPVNVV